MIMHVSLEELGGRGESESAKMDENEINKLL